MLGFPSLVTGCPWGLAVRDLLWSWRNGGAGGAGGAKGFETVGCPAPGSPLGRQGMSHQCPGETPSPRLAGKDAQSWQPNSACLHSTFPLLPALEITPSLCFPGMWRQCTLGLADRLPSAGPFPGTQVPRPGLQHRGQPSWQGAPGASSPCLVPTCPRRRHGRAQPLCLHPCTDKLVPCCQAASPQLAWPRQGKKDAVPMLGQWPWQSLGQCLEDILLAKSPCWL